MSPQDQLVPDLDAEQVKRSTAEQVPESEVDGAPDTTDQQASQAEPSIDQALEMNIDQALEVIVEPAPGAVYGQEPRSAQFIEETSEERRLAIRRTVQSLIHVCYCYNVYRYQASCSRLKRVIEHARACRRNMDHRCNICRKLIALCVYHAKSCHIPGCRVPYCSKIRNRLEQADHPEQRSSHE